MSASGNGSASNLVEGCEQLIAVKCSRHSFEIPGFEIRAADGNQAPAWRREL
jgi:hypothetical protein